MIEHISGTIHYKTEDHVVIEASGVGYGIDVTSRASLGLPSIGERGSLWIYTLVREDAILLYGFSTRAEREAFVVFMGISGLGPKIGMAILSRFTNDDMIQIIAIGDVKRLTQVPGIGAKKAEKLLLELKGRIDRLTGGIDSARLAKLTAGQSVDGITLPGSENVSEAIAALESLDVPNAAARKAVALAIETVGAEAATVTLIREALRHRHG